MFIFLDVSLEYLPPTSNIQSWHKPGKNSNVCSSFHLDDLLNLDKDTNDSTVDNTDSFLNIAISNNIKTSSTNSRNAKISDFMFDHGGMFKNLPLVMLDNINKCDPIMIQLIERKTRKQSNCELWWNYRKSRITGKDILKLFQKLLFIDVIEILIKLL